MIRQRLGRTGLTSRAAGFMATGVALIALGLRAGWPPVAQIGIFLAALPLMSWAAVGLRRDNVSANRRLNTGTPQLGDPIGVVLAVTPRGGGLGPIMVVDSAPTILGGTHVAAISGSSRQSTTRHRYKLIAARRGTYLLGPAHLYLTDRLGLVTRGRQILGTTEVVVVPRVHPLPTGIPIGSTSGPGWGKTGAPGGNHDDVIPREYRAGDELRRMDWRATARSGTLMVRGEEQPWRACLLVVLDRRKRAHRGPIGADSFETALSLIASVGAMALASGWDLRIVDLDAIAIFQSNPNASPERNGDTLSRSLSALQTSNSDHLETTLSNELSEGGPLLAVLADSTIDTVAAVANLLAQAHPAMAAVLAAATWEEDAAAPGPAAAEAVGILRHSGWLAGTVTATTPIPEVWGQLQAAANVSGAARPGSA